MSKWRFTIEIWLPLCKQPTTSWTTQQTTTQQTADNKQQIYKSYRTGGVEFMWSILDRDEKRGRRTQRQHQKQQQQQQQSILNISNTN